MKTISILITFFLCFIRIDAQIPEYYSNVNFEQRGASLRLQLSELITDTHQTFLPYTSNAIDTWDVMRISDLFSQNSSSVLLIYGYDDEDEDFINDRTRDAYSTCHTGSCVGKWNREHVFARSLSNPALTTNVPGPGTDVHNLRAADSQKNSQRSNRLFADGSGNSGIVGGDFFFPGDEWKGDVARIIMYMHLRYPGQCNAVNTTVGQTNYAAQEDMPDLLLEWNQEDPVSDFELTRNDLIYSYQGNRNPFIDNPAIANYIWGGPEPNDSWNYLNQVDIYPIVCDDNINIVSNKTEIKLDYSIINLNGDIVQSGKAFSDINLENHSTGAYYLKLGFEENEKKFTIYIQNSN